MRHEKTGTSLLAGRDAHNAGLQQHPERGFTNVAGNAIEFVRGAVEVFLNDLLPAGEAITSAHGKIFSDFSVFEHTAFEYMQ